MIILQNEIAKMIRKNENQNMNYKYIIVNIEPNNQNIRFETLSILPPVS